ncbi:hypothetical protein HW02_33700 [Pseudomonas aeruginosa]|nr:hypothetical protein HW02_33700 [Pseudomonas aeruginosa]
MNGGALFNAEFGIRHRGSTVPERSGVALSFCRRLEIKAYKRILSSKPHLLFLTHSGPHHTLPVHHDNCSSLSLESLF